MREEDTLTEMRPKDIERMRTIRSSTLLVAAMLLLPAAAPGVTVETWEEDEPKEFEEGTCDKTVVSSLGRVLLGRDEVEALEPTENVDFVNALAQAPDGTMYAATGPSGLVFKIVDGKAERLAKIKDAANLFSLLIAEEGSLLVGSGGAVGKIYKVTRQGDVSVWFDPEQADIERKGEEPEGGQAKEDEADAPEEPGEEKDEAEEEDKDGADAAANKPAATTKSASKPSTTTAATASVKKPHKYVNYIWAMARGANGQVYAATGAKGWLLEILPDGKKARVVFDAKQSNLLCLAIGKKGELYSGSDKEGLVYRIAPEPGKAFVLYDADEPEISAVALDAAGNVYAATAAAAEARPGKTVKPKPAGRPGKGATKPSSKASKAGPAAIRRSVGKVVRSGSKPSTPSDAAKGGGNAVYRIAPDGMVREVFREPVMILDMVESDGSLFLSTGNEGRVYEVRPQDEEQIALAKLKGKQATAMLRSQEGRLWVGMSNEGRVVKLSAGYAEKGTFISQVLDAKQISRWGRLLWEGRQPKGTTVTVATRSGNVSDPKEGTWDSWSKELDARRATQVPSPSARFLQYRLTLTTENADVTPRVRLVKIARQSDNQAPKLTAVEVGDPLRSRKKKGSSSGSSGSSPPRPLPPGTTPATRIIKWKAEDANGDRMLYDIYFRMLKHKRWILLKEDNKSAEFKWDASKVADGPYEIRVVAKDSPSNPPKTALRDDRISDLFVVDNTPPIIGPVKTEKTGKGKVAVHAVIEDKHTPVTEAQYAVDSQDDWTAVLAEDDLFDSKRESIRFTVENLEPGEHVITIRAEDDQENKGYTTVVVDVAE